MTRLFILQVLLLIDWSILSNGEDPSEEPSQDKFVLHIPIPITTFKHTHAIFKVTENDGKKHHDLEIYQPRLHHVNSYHHRGSGNRDHKRGSKKGRQHSKTSGTDQKQTKKEKHSPEKTKDEKQFYHFFSKGRDPDEDIFNRYFTSEGNFRHDARIPSHPDKKNQLKPTEYRFRDGGRTDRSQNSVRNRNRYQDHSDKSQGHSRKQNKTSYRQKNKKGGKTRKSKPHDHYRSNSNDDRSEESDTKAHQEEEAEDSSFNFESVASKAPHDEINMQLPKLQPNWAEEGLVSPFALNDVLFKDKKYNKKVFRELGWYPLFLPYEVVEDQERK